VSLSRIYPELARLATKAPTKIDGHEVLDLVQVDPWDDGTILALFDLEGGRRWWASTSNRGDTWHSTATNG
jgi:hypothetical protein